MPILQASNFSPRVTSAPGVNVRKKQTSCWWSGPTTFNTEQVFSGEGMQISE